MRWVVMLAGGTGSRFWPLTSPKQPKQLLPFTGGIPTAKASVQAVLPLVGRDRVLVVTGKDLAGPLRDELELPAANILIEPRAASTGPALVWATHEVVRLDPSATVLAMHADWHLPDPEAFRQSANLALETAVGLDRLVTTGIAPTRVETGYGYMVPGDSLSDQAWNVVEFVEKPPRQDAEELIARGALWNSGLFAWSADRLLAEVAVHMPEVASSLPLLDQGEVDRYYGDVKAISIDEGLFERSTNVAVIRGEFPWDDVGDWEALTRIRTPDVGGNVTQGDIHLVEAENCVAWSESVPVVLASVRDLVVVEANGRILVTHRTNAAHLKRVLDALPPHVRDLE